MKVIVGLVASISIVLAGCGGGGGGGGYFSSATDSTPNGFTVESGVAQKGPLMQGSQVTIDELSVWNLQPSGRSFNFEITNNLGTFNTTGINFSSPYLSTTADGYYFNELTGLPSTDTVFLRGLSYLYGRGDTVINVNVLSNFSKNRIVNLATGKNLIDPSTGAAITATPKPFLAARAQAQAENFKAAYIYNSATILSGTPLNGVVQPSYFTALDLSKNRTADQILAAASAAVMTAGQNGNGVNTLLSQIEADFADDGLLNNSPKYAQSVASRLCAAAASTDFAKVATNLNTFYGTNYQATDLSQWVDTSGCADQVINKYKFTATNVAAGTESKSPAYIAGPDDAGQCFSVGGVSAGATGRLYYKGATTAVAATQKVVLGDSLTVGVTAGSAGSSSAFIQRSAPSTAGACPATVPSSGLTRVHKYTVSTFPTYTIGGTVAGLAAGKSVTLLNNGSDALTVSANNAFTFATPFAVNAAYAVTVGTQPAGQTCTVSNGSGTANSVVSNVNINCAAASTELHLGTVSGVNLNLIAPITVNGNTFYFLDQNSNGIAECGGVDDSVDHIKLNNLFNGGQPTTVTANTIVVNNYTLALATQADIFSIRSQYSYAPPPGWWGNNTTNSSTYNCIFSTADLARMYNATTGVHYNTWMGSNTGPSNNPTGNGVFTNLYDGYGYNGLVAVRVVNNNPVVDNPVQLIASGFVWPQGIVVDPSGNIFVADSNSAGNATDGVYKFTPPSISGQPYTKSLYYKVANPTHMVLDASQNMYVSEYNAGQIIKIPPGGASSSVYASGLYDPEQLAFDGNNNLYVAQNWSGYVAKISPPSGSGQALVTKNFAKTPYYYANGLAVDSSGNIYVHSNDQNMVNSAVTKITPTGSLSTYSNVQGYGDMVFDDVGNIYTTSGNGISIIDPTGKVSILDTGMTFASPQGLAFDKEKKTLYLTTAGPSASLYKIDLTKIIQTKNTGLLYVWYAYTNVPVAYEAWVNDSLLNEHNQSNNPFWTNEIKAIDLKGSTQITTTTTPTGSKISIPRGSYLKGMKVDITVTGFVQAWATVNFNYSCSVNACTVNQAWSSTPGVTVSVALTP